MTEYADYAWLVSDAAGPWLERAAHDRRPALQIQATLRRELPAGHARLLIEQTALRRRAVAKFGPLAEKLFFTPVHLEQATDWWIARYKAARFAAVAPVGVADYCCGIGGDLLALATVASATGWDLSPVACLLAEANLRAARDDAELHAATVRQADVAATAPGAGECWHVDPDRRAGSQRTTRIENYMPGPELVDRWLAANDRGAVKLAPAAEAPDAWAERGELEWVSRGGECRQLIAWFGTLAERPGWRRATAVCHDAIGDPTIPLGGFAGLPHVECDWQEQPQRYLFDPDPSVLAAELLGALATNHGLATLGAGGAYLTGEQAVDDPLLAGFEVQECLPLRADALTRYFAGRDIGRLEIKKRGVTADPQALRKRLKLRGGGEATLVLTRIARREIALVVQRLGGT